MVDIGWLNMESGIGKLEISFTIFLQQIIGGKLFLIIIWIYKLNYFFAYI